MRMNKQKKGLVPELRFPDFKDEAPWINRLLASVLNEHGLKSSGKEIVFSVSVHKGLINQIEHLGRSFSASNTDNYNRVLPGDIVYTKSPTGDFPLGIIKQSRVDYPVIVSPLYGVFTPETRGLGTLLDAYFETPANTRLYLEPLVQKGAKNTISITNKKFLSGRLPLPISQVEQEKLGLFIDTIDELIDLHTQKLNALKNHKKGLIQQLFPSGGEVVPKLRFPEYRNKAEWKKIVLKNLVEIRSGFSPSKYVLDARAEIAFLKVEDLNNCEKYQIKSRFYSNDREGIVPAGSVIFPKRGAAISLNKVRLNINDVLIDTNLMALTPNNKIHTEFLYYLILSIGLFKIADMSTIPQINNKHINPYEVLVPSKEEQEKVIGLLSSVDSLISAQVEIVDELKLHKSGLTQKLFPVMDGVVQ